MIQRIFSAGVTAVLIFMMIAFPATAARTNVSQGGGRVAGGVQYEVASISRQAQLAITQGDNGSAKGIFHYSDEFGEWYKVYVQYAIVEDNTAYFAGEVISASNPDWVGHWLSGAVKDGGSEQSDQLAGVFATQEQALSDLDNRSIPGDLYSIATGNILIYNF